jgi:Zn-dependent alcohol dehydrogenase
VVNVSRIPFGQDDELALMAPLGCGGQTGTGAIIHAANAGPKDRVVVIGLGGVGLSAVMGAKIAGCAQIIGIDRYESRLELARELGATDVINTASTSSLCQVSDMVLTKTKNLGANITLDTTGVQDLIQESIRMTAFKGKILQVGAAPMDATLKIPIFEFMSDGKQYMGVVEGDVDPRQYIPKMIEWIREGRLPLQKIVKFYDAEDYEKAIDDMKAGKTIKPVIRW